MLVLTRLGFTMSVGRCFVRMAGVHVSDKEGWRRLRSGLAEPTPASRQDLREEEVHGSRKGQQVGSRAFRCGYKGCGRLYTTAHHLKVKRVTRGHAEQPCPRVLVPDQNTAVQKAECVLGSPGDPGLFIGPGEIQQ